MIDYKTIRIFKEARDIAMRARDVFPSKGSFSVPVVTMASPRNAMSASMPMWPDSVAEFDVEAARSECANTAISYMQALDVFDVRVRIGPVEVSEYWDHHDRLNVQAMCELTVETVDEIEGAV